MTMPIRFSRLRPAGGAGALVLAVMLMLALAFTARAGKQEGGTTAAPPARTSAAADNPAFAPSAAARRGTADALLAGKAYSAQTVPAKAKGNKKRPSARASATPGRQMLKSAGRDPDALQPEKDFALHVPGSIGDGEAFAVEFSAEGARSVTLSWRGKDLALSRDDNPSGPFRALLPVPLDEKAKLLPLVLNVWWADGRSERFAADIPVRKRKYPVQRLTVDRKFVTPPPEVREKIQRDRAEMRASIAKVSSRRYWNLPLLRPVPGEVTSLYGLRRVFNGQPKSPHKGVDFDGKEGDPVAAVEDGVVMLASEHYYGGKTVVVDHGLGVFSAYLHLSAFSVGPGQKVARGETLGHIGSTGRVTGPHLHLSLYVLGESVNAAPCIAM